MHRYNFENGFFKDVEVKINMEIFMSGEDYETTYEEKEEHIKNLVKYITRDKDITKVYDIEVLDIF
ncbi:hypothetical protein [Veillonella sp. 3310]|uniref:hypothetical protein n=1 Tax=Veillonella sp. 3310 TaxID=2490956 RepID=UPI000FD64B6D|nr:hypothetical protein [Veillonella sp. 3310]